MREKYIKELKEYLENKNILVKEIKDIVEDYSILYDEAIDLGLTDEEVVSKLGSPKEIYQSLKEDLKKEVSIGSKLVPIMVFVSLILFFVIGKAFDLWAYSWMFFFTVPMTAIITANKNKSRLPGITVFVSIAIFMILGLSFNLWHPGWLAFLLIPISGILVSENEDLLLNVSPFVSLITYFILAYINSSYYLYAWPVFLLIPIISTFYIKNKLNKILLLSSLLVSIIAYYILSITYSNWSWPLLVFIIPLNVGVLTKEIKFFVEIDSISSGLVVLFNIVIYLVVSLLTKSWAWSWTILMFFPMYLIYKENKFKDIVAYTPFISVVLFFILGYFIKGGFAYSWLFFLMIPMTAILFPSKSKERDK